MGGRLLGLQGAGSPVRVLEPETQYCRCSQPNLQPGLLLMDGPSHLCHLRPARDISALQRNPSLLVRLQTWSRPWTLQISFHEMGRALG